MEPKNLPMKTRRSLWCLALLVGALGCQTENTDYAAVVANPEYYHRSMRAITDRIVHDIFSPPVASRIYAYSAIAGYEAMVPSNASYQSLAGQLNGLSPVPQPSSNWEYSPELASLQASLLVAQPLVHSGGVLAEYREALMAEIQEASGIPSRVLENSLAYGTQVADHIKAWMATDGYAETRTFPKYTIREETAYWKPTPPDYMQGIEPHWNEMRPFVLDSASQFMPPPPTPFSMEEDSPFYAELMEVYTTGNELDEERTTIAKFWDCNPYVSKHHGHAMYAVKKITPGGHWIGITAIASRKAGLGFAQTLEAYTRVSIALNDAFISCWDEKWRSILVRPETLIAEFIDREWRPLLQTPPFPEYTSGHSVISRAAAITLTELLGDDFAFHDTTEQAYGLPPRDFTSFLQASEEAAISRLYGGIHYMPAIKNGIAQGEEVGKYIIAEVNTRVPSMAATKPED